MRLKKFETECFEMLKKVIVYNAMPLACVFEYRKRFSEDREWAEYRERWAVTAKTKTNLRKFMKFCRKIGIWKFDDRRHEENLTLTSCKEHRRPSFSHKCHYKWWIMDFSIWSRNRGSIFFDHFFSIKAIWESSLVIRKTTERSLSHRWKEF